MGIVCAKMGDMGFLLGSNNCLSVSSHLQSTVLLQATGGTLDCYCDSTNSQAWPSGAPLQQKCFHTTTPRVQRLRFNLLDRCSSLLTFARDWMPTGKGGCLYIVKRITMGIVSKSTKGHWKRQPTPKTYDEMACPVIKKMKKGTLPPVAMARYARVQRRQERISTPLTTGR